MSNPLFDKAISEHKAGHFAEAEALYREVISTEPNNADALALLGSVLESLSKAGDGIGFIEKAVAIDPGAALFRFYLGNALASAGRAEEAVEAYGQAIAMQPNMPQVHYNLGNVLRSLNWWEEAGKEYAKAAQLDPQYYDARNNLALVYEREGRFREAIHEIQEAIKILPHKVEGWLTLCQIADSSGDYDQSHDAAMQAIILDAQNAFAYLGLGVAFNRMERHDEAVAAYTKALSIKPDWVEAWDNIGQTYQFLNRLDDAEKAFRKTVELSGQNINGEDTRQVGEKEYGNRHWHLALLELLKGDYKRGFARYRARFEDLGVKRPACSEPVWRGEDVKGKTVLVYDEQGMGDCIMLARYLPLLKARGAKVKFLVNPALVPLFKDWDGADEVVARGEQPGQFDFHASVFDLPYGFGTTIETVPANVPYLPMLQPDDETKLEDNGKLKVGVVWAGAPKHKQDLRRSIPLELFSGIFLESRIQFYSLNRDMRPGDAETLKKFSNVTDLVPRLRHFGDAARFVSQLDLVITCDTATAHLAGGMGKQVWTLLPFAPDWRWLLHCDDSVWYPTMRLFRQKATGDWKDVISRVKTALKNK